MCARYNIGRMFEGTLALADIAAAFDGWSSADDVASATHEYAALWARVRRGDESAFKSLVLELGAPLQSYARRFLPLADAAEDIVQDVFAHMWESRATVEVRGTVRGYLYAAVRNRALNERKRAISEDARLAAAGAETVSGLAERSRWMEHSPDAHLYRQEIMARVTAALATLPPRAREVALLRWRDGLGRGEIAAVMGIAVPTVNNQLTLAAKVVRSLLADLRPSL